MLKDRSNLRVFNPMEIEVRDEPFEILLVEKSQF